MHQTIASLEEKHTSRCLAEVAIKSKFITRFRMIGFFMNYCYFTVLKNWSEIHLFYICYVERHNHIPAYMFFFPPYSHIEPS